MGALEQIEERLGLKRDQWDIDQWRSAAESLAELIPEPNPEPKTKKKGRPKLTGDQRFWSKAANYQALAWKVKERMDEARAAGNEPIMKDLVREEMHKSWVRHQANERELPNFKPVRESRIAEMLPTVYTEVRKILKTWQSGD